MEKRQPMVKRLRKPLFVVSIRKVLGSGTNMSTGEESVRFGRENESCRLGRDAVYGGHPDC